MWLRAHQASPQTEGPGHRRWTLREGQRQLSTSSRRAAQPSRRCQDFPEVIDRTVALLDSGGRWLWYKDTDSEIDLKAAYP